MEPSVREDLKAYQDELNLAGTLQLFRAAEAGTARNSTRATSARLAWLAMHTAQQQKALYILKHPEGPGSRESEDSAVL